MFSVVIVDFNSIEETMQYVKRCICSIVEQENLHFIIVDNFPDSRIKGFLEAKNIMIQKTERWKKMEVLQINYHRHNIHIIITGCNNGYARGNNLGILYSKEEWDDPYIIISNNDILFEEKFSLFPLVNIMESNNDIAVVGPRVTDIHCNVQSPYKKQSFLYLLFWSYLLILISKCISFTYRNNMLDYDGRNKRCYWVSGCFFVADRKRLEEAGNFDESTFLYAEEMILSERLKKSGYTMYFYNDAGVTHLGSNTVNKYFKDLEVEETIFCSYLYYFSTYRNLSLIIIKIAQGYFKILKSIFRTGQKINRIMKLK